MTQKIKILDPAEAIKIAAGEVIERPAHIIKELLENSIDAGAKNITLHLQAAGKDLIKITDDGSGMSQQDAALCFAHHATSKINTVNDLSSITTYGFRGEALSSIASVSHVELISKTEFDTLATKIIMAHGKKVEQSQTNHQTGTTLIISQLFDQIPARKKFLKTDETEWNLIVTIFQAFALRYPEINFKIFHNDQLAYNCPGTKDLKNRCAQLWNATLHEQILELSEEKENKIKIYGAISSMHYYRFNRGQIFTFVNNRWVKNAELYKGILKGYDGVLPAQKFPAAFIFIEIDPAEIDVNIHPKKEEVKFLHPTTVQRLVQNCVKNRLEQCVQKVLEKTEIKPTAAPISKIFNFNNTISNQKIDSLPNFSLSDWAAQDTEVVISKPILSHVAPTNHRNIPIEKNTVIHEPEKLFNIVGQFKKTYIIAEQNEQLIMIDQHAAHERILYERFKLKSTNQEHVTLLFPHIVKLAPQQVALLADHEQILTKHGIVTEQFSDREIIIRATPVQISADGAAQIIHTILQWMETHQNLQTQEILQHLNEKLLAERACKTAFKAGDTLSIEQMQSLLLQLQKTANNFCCPHGRPTMWNVTLKEIEKQFKRDYVGSKSLF